MLEQIESPDLAAYIVWVPRNGARERHVKDALGLVTDERAAQYWDAHGAILEPYDAMYQLTGPCAGIFMVFGPDAVWGEEAPVPEYAEDAHARQFDRVLPQWDAEQFAERVAQMVHR